MMGFLIEQIGRLTWPAGKQGRLAVLMYHRVLADADPLRPWDVDREQFDRQMRLLSRRFNVLPLREAVESLFHRGDLPRHAVSITFDDGYRDNHDNALPILKNYDLPATFFIATGYLNGGCMWNDLFIEAIRLTDGVLDLEDVGLGRHSIMTVEERLAAVRKILPKLKYLPFAARKEFSAALARKAGVDNVENIMMSSEQVRSLRKAGMEIGAHTARHPILANEPSNDVESDILESKRFLEELLGETVEGFAYPNGKPGQDYHREHVDLLMKAGFHYAVSTAWGIADRNSHRYQIPRLLPWDKDISRFQARILRSLWGAHAEEV